MVIYMFDITQQLMLNNTEGVYPLIDSSNSMSENDATIEAITDRVTNISVHFGTDLEK